MNPAQFKLYQVLHDHRNEPVSPTIKELGEYCNCNSRSAIWGRLEGLVQAGYIEIDRGGPGRRNVIRLTEKRPAGFGQVFKGFMTRDSNGRYLPGTFTTVAGRERSFPVIISIEERNIG